MTAEEASPGGVAEASTGGAAEASTGGAAEAGAGGPVEAGTVPGNAEVDFWPVFAEASEVGGEVASGVSKMSSK